MGKRMKPLPSQDELLRLFDHDPLTGILRWRVRPHAHSGRREGDEAGNLAVLGYRVVTIDYKIYKVHRVIWKMMTGEDADTVDHIDRDKVNNRLANLRDATPSEQNYNRRMRRLAPGEVEIRVAALSDECAKSKPRDVRAKTLPSQERLKELFDYDPLIGLLIHRTSSTNGRRKAGNPVTTLCKGYVKVFVDNREGYAHRIAWKIMTGEEPEVVDHIDGNRANNVWDNLRDVRAYQNQGNTSLYRNNKSGVKGVYWAKDKNRWTAQISIGDKIRYLGRFVSIEDAKKAYDAAALIHFGFVTDTERKTA
jgi:hypothetical protein